MRRREIIKTVLGGTIGLALSGRSATASLQRKNAGNGLRERNAVLKKGYLNGPFGQIHYYESGEGPCLIMAHQSPVSGRSFEDVLPVLGQAGIRAIAIDTPGYGSSDVPPSPPTIADYADTYNAALDGLGLRRAHFLGHHTGAGILCNFAARYPKRVTSLILNGPPLFSEDDLEQFQGMVLGPHPIHEDGSHLLESWNRRVKFSPGWSDKVAMHRRLVEQMWAGDTSWYGHNAAFNYDMKPDFLSLQGAVLILTNTGDDIYHLAQKARVLRPDFAYAELEGGTHDILNEQPQAWSNIVSDFVLRRG